MIRVSSRKMFGGKYLEIAQHEVPCDFEHQASSGVWFKSISDLRCNHTANLFGEEARLLGGEASPLVDETLMM